MQTNQDKDEYVEENHAKQIEKWMKVIYYRGDDKCGKQNRGNPIFTQSYLSRKYEK